MPENKPQGLFWETAASRPGLGAGTSASASLWLVEINGDLKKKRIEHQEAKQITYAQEQFVELF